MVSRCRVPTFGSPRSHLDDICEIRALGKSLAGHREFFVIATHITSCSTGLQESGIRRPSLADKLVEQFGTTGPVRDMAAIIYAGEACFRSFYNSNSIHRQVAKAQFVPTVNSLNPQLT